MVSFCEAMTDYVVAQEGELALYLNLIGRNGRKLSNIVDELLLLASVHRMPEVDLKPLDMADIVAEAQQRLVHLIEEHGVQINSCDEWPAAVGYGPWVEEVWVNYLSNAIKYGGQPPCVEFGATVQSDGQVCFWLRDNGRGLTSEEQGRLFTPFERLDRVRAKGHGLGLSIVRHIVEKLGGHVTVESQIGHGSVFGFTLPGVE
jgi:signal transduction histidine kinase